MSERHHWPNKWIFILAAIGSAAGLGNLWRFPYLAFEHGGGTFLLVIILANLIVGIPLLLAEVAIGQKMQKGAPDALRKIKENFKYVGWTMVVFSFFVISYYIAVMGWGLDYLWGSFSISSWAADTKGYFFGEVLQISDGPGMMGGFSKPVLIGILLSLAAIYFSVWKGVKSVSKVVTWTATAPFVLLFILILRAVTLDGAGAGLQLFFIPDWSALADSQLWIAAFSQVFFSLSVAFGVMMAYGSYNSEGTSLTKNIVWIALGNFLVSLMSGIVVFATLGYMALQQGVAINEIFAGGPGLAFIVFPEAISLLPALSSLFAVVFFIMFFLLALDSAFSLIEGVAAPFRDRFPHISSKKITLAITILVFIVGLLYVTKAGLYYLDITDHFLVNYGLIIMGIMLSIIAGWKKADSLKRFVNERSKWKIGTLWTFSLKYFTPIFLIILLILNVKTELSANYEGYPTWSLLAFGVLPIILAPIIGIIAEKMTSRKSPSDNHHHGDHHSTEPPTPVESDHNNI